MAKARGKTAAKLTIFGPGKMTERGRKDIIAWLRTTANHMRLHGKNYTEGRYTGSFNYTAR